MKSETLSLLRCPSGCADDLCLTSEETANGAILRGALACPVCRQAYPIQEGIVRMLPDILAEPESSADSEDPVEIERKRSEMAARDAQVEDYDRMRGLELFGKYWEIPSTLAELNPGSNDVLLEAGCGTGRMSPSFAKRCKHHFAVDFSMESLRVCKRKLERAGLTNVTLIQADICALPLKDNGLDRVVSCGVLEHVPTVASRAKMIAELARVAKGGSPVVISAYYHNLYTRLFGEKEGAHSGGIYFFRYSRQELQEALTQSLAVEHISGKLVYYYLARCRKPVGVSRKERE